MMSPRPSTSASLAAALVVVALAFGVARLNSAGAASATIPGVGLLRLGGAWDQGSGYDRYSTMIASAWVAQRAAAEPGRSLVYMSGTNVDSTYDTGVPYTQAQQNGWLLKNSSGSPLQNTSYPAKTIADVGNPAYQQAWANNVAAFLAANGNDGVFVDDVVADISTATGSGFPPKYPSQQAWANALVSFFSYVGPALKAKGYYVAVNADAYVRGDSTGASNDGSGAVAWFSRLAPYVNGIMQENWIQSPTDYALRASGGNWNQQWDGWEHVVSAVEGLGVDFIGLTYSSPGDTRTMRYGKASFLLEWDGSGSAFIFNPTDGSDPWNTEWTTDVGKPVGTRYQVGVGWRRNFTGGTAIVNPSTSTSQTFALGGSFITASGSTVTSVTLAPTTGLVLRSTTPLPAPAPAPVPVPAPPPVVTPPLTTPPPSSTFTVTSSLPSVISNSVSWTATASSSSVSSVVFSIDGVEKWTEELTPYVFNGDGGLLDTKTLGNGPHTFTVVVTAGGQTVTKNFQSTVSNLVVTPTPPPPVTPPPVTPPPVTPPPVTPPPVTPPPSGSFTVASSLPSVISNSVSWTATASSSSVSSVVFSIDGVAKWTEEYSPYVFNGDGAQLNTKALGNGMHTFLVTAKAGGQTATRSFQSMVSNSTGGGTTPTPTPPPPSPPIPPPTPPTGGGSPPPAAPGAFSVSSSLTDGQKVHGSVQWTATVDGIPTSSVRSVVFWIDGKALSTEQFSPYVFGGDDQMLDTWRYPHGMHTFMIVATATDGRTATLTFQVKVD